jgi:hypothetical protein
MPALNRCDWKIRENNKAKRADRACSAGFPGAVRPDNNAKIGDVPNLHIVECSDDLFL